ncbi:MAG: protoporphyrinogen oxidase [bacterium]|nr:protoporphyrinogen oxidase [bacterium]
MKIAIIGGGITGLTAGHEAAKSGADVTVYEASHRAGGCISSSDFTGQPVDEGPDAFLARVSWATDLCTELGLKDQLVAPAKRQAYVYSHGALRLLPAPNVLGVPLDMDALAASGIVSPQGIQRARQEPPYAGLAPDADITVGQFVRQQLGNEVAERLVDPLIGGINAASIDELSLRAAAPQLAGAASAGGSLVEALRQITQTTLASAPAAASTASTASAAPVFFTLREGLASLVDALVARLGERLKLCTPVTNLTDIDADRIIITVPASAASSLLVDVSPQTAACLESIRYASVVLLTLAFEAKDVEHPMDGSGYLVPAVEGRLLTACSWASTKWAHIGLPNQVVLRASVGRYGQQQATQMDDAHLLSAVRADLAATMGLTAEPSDVRISRWTNSFPQFRLGHTKTVAQIRQALAQDAPHILATGAWAQGLGLPACIQQGRTAAQASLGKSAGTQ